MNNRFCHCFVFLLLFSGNIRQEREWKENTKYREQSKVQLEFVKSCKLRNKEIAKIIFHN